MDQFEEIVHLFEHAHYLGIFIVLVLCGVGLPVPEEVSFVAAGYLVYAGHTKFLPTVVVGYAGVICGDTITYWAGRHYGPRLYTMWPFRYLLTPKMLAKVQQHFDRHGSKTVFFAGFAMGLRVASFFVSGSMKVSFWVFILMDTLRVLITMPVSIWAGKYFGHDIDLAWELLADVKGYVFITVGALLGFLIVRHYVRKSMKVRGNGSAAQAPTPASADPPAGAEAAVPAPGEGSGKQPQP